MTIVRLRHHRLLAHPRLVHHQAQVLAQAVHRVLAVPLVNLALARRQVPAIVPVHPQAQALIPHLQAQARLVHPHPVPRHPVRVLAVALAVALAVVRVPVHLVPRYAVVSANTYGQDHSG